MSDKTSTRHKSARPGTRLRGQLAEAYGARGGHQSVLWLHYSAKAERDFAFHSNLEYGHYLLVESDIEIEKPDYAPQKRVARVAGELLATCVDAELQLRSGGVVWREVKYSDDLAAGAANRASLQILVQQQAAQDAAVTHQVITEKEIFANPQRIRNWHLIIPWLASAREWALHDYSTEVALLVRRHGRIEFRHALALGAPEKSGLYGAALLRLVQVGRLSSDLDDRPFTPRSVFFQADES